MSTETETAVSDWPIAEETLAACPGAREFYARYDEIVAAQYDLARGPVFTAVQALRREQEEHLGWFMHPDDMPPWLSRAEGMELPDGETRLAQVLEPLPEQPSGHAWLDETAAAFAQPDEAADAAVERFEAVHDEQDDPDEWAFDEPGYTHEDVLAAAPDVEKWIEEDEARADGDEEPAGDEPGPEPAGRFFPFDGDSGPSAVA